VSDQSIEPTDAPEEQQFYRLNLAALPWRRFSPFGSTGPLVLRAPVVAFCKLFRLRFCLGVKCPRHVTFTAPDPAMLRGYDQAVAEALAAMLRPGFERFTTFTWPEVPADNVQSAFLNRSGQAYGLVMYLPVRLLPSVSWQFVTFLADGGSLLTTTSPDLWVRPAGRHIQVLWRALPEDLWEAHQAKLAEVAPAAGGAKPVSPEAFVQDMLRSRRELCDTMEAAGVFVPVD
jgi:hypothetical protein